MPKKGEIFWEVGKNLLKETWSKGECVSSPEFPITENCSLIVEFYPAGMTTDSPTFKLIRTNTEGALKMCFGSQLCHGITIVKMYRFEDVFNDGDSSSSKSWFLEDIGSLRLLKIFHSLPELCYRLIYTIMDA
ncbi:hypothetical protein HNY73_012100 [Argiope bruennichi]|uniref:Uncharacterized protein n=1 Tax=Argiope bruennichi TaxID=94029 RepID=A0A8T0EVF7_ARGBR|nr:hypothetical protein HNY73_012100 [Argiope bruennichi]